MEKRIETIEMPVKDLKDGFENPRKITAKNVRNYRGCKHEQK